MNAYIIAHAPFFLPSQLAGLARAYGECDTTVVAARGSGGKFAGHDRVLQSPTHGLLPMLDWLFDHATDGPAVFLEYDVVPVARVRGNWMNQRGVQERSQTLPMRGLWPAAFGWESKSQFRREFFRTLENPFVGNWRPVIQDRAAVRGGLPECAEKSDFRMIGNELLHYVNGTSRMTRERNRCFSCCLEQFGIQWQGPEVTHATGRPGLGDMVANGLAAVGITKSRVQAVASAVGIKDCGCAGRQAALNSVGRTLGIGGPAK